MPHRVAIIHPNMLIREGLATLLERYFAPVEIDKFHNAQQCATSAESHYDHYFTDGTNYALASDYLVPRRSQCIILTDCPQTPPQAVQSLDIHSDAEQIIDNLFEIMNHSSETLTTPACNSSEISVRETEVLTLVVSGAINKEIAARLNISLNTVLTHRKNITAKLGIKSISGLTLYALMNGYISADQISTQQ